MMCPAGNFLPSWQTEDEKLPHKCNKIDDGELAHGGQPYLKEEYDEPKPTEHSLRLHRYAPRSSGSGSGHSTLACRALWAAHSASRRIVPGAPGRGQPFLLYPLHRIRRYQSGLQGDHCRGSSGLHGWRGSPPLRLAHPGGHRRVGNEQRGDPECTSALRGYTTFESKPWILVSNQPPGGLPHGIGGPLVLAELCFHSFFDDRLAIHI